MHGTNHPGGYRYRSRNGQPRNQKPLTEQHTMNLGTILPAREGLAKADRIADRQAAAREAAANRKFDGLEKRIVGSEIRYYLRPTIYVTVKDRWFETRPDGDHSIPAPVIL